MDGFQKMCDTNKNVTKMGVIVDMVYYSSIAGFEYLSILNKKIKQNVIPIY
jgi:hypothetical protein